MITVLANTIIYPEIILRSTVSIATNLVSSIQYLNSLSNQDLEIQGIFQASDILSDIDVIKCFLQEIEKFGDHSSPTINNCVINLSRVLSELEENINSITQKLQIHQTLWFNRFRSYNISKEKEQIPLLIEKARHRFELLIKLSTVLKK